MEEIHILQHTKEILFELYVLAIMRFTLFYLIIRFFFKVSHENKNAYFIRDSVTNRNYI